MTIAPAVYAGLAGKTGRPGGGAGSADLDPCLAQSRVVGAQRLADALRCGQVESAHVAARRALAPHHVDAVDKDRRGREPPHALDDHRLHTHGGQAGGERLFGGGGVRTSWCGEEFDSHTDHRFGADVAGWALGWMSLRIGQ